MRYGPVDRRFAGERVALGAREVDDDLGLVFEFRMEFVLDGGEVGGGGGCRCRP